ncbi:sigma-70 family RNA polymerase sigma factor [Achromobacter denitrificans]|uniref:Sigma-70 family RNA polymerase sigma factor n=1 Tax=Achromobacter denitrificans TaxID=32002 RepID=A0ABZ3G9T8_ACHDE|nr:sigma-70 family RNA polymerase sigma factor [Achromobacter denitrificans]MDF3848540.1 sigma-70 family RNA polymerase sigma factor [Achromobacter denitrificans]MDF3862328.1 sigma-70 family RNA polymerase sigma factor [Achromobacter denitrificans]
MRDSTVTAANQPAAQHALSALYLDHHGWLAGWLRRRLGCAHDAADLSHDTYERLLRSGRLPEAGQARAFLTQIAKGLVVDLFRRRSLETAYLDALAQLPEAHMPSAEARALALETLIAVDAALDALPARARQVFILSRFEGLKYSEIAQRLDVSVALVRKHMLRAAQACMAAL